MGKTLCFPHTIRVPRKHPHVHGEDSPERVYLLQWPFNVLKKGRAITEQEAADLESSEYFGFVQGSKKPSGTTRGRAK